MVRRALFLAPPPRAALAWVEGAVGRGARVTSSVPLAGATTTAVHALQVRCGGGTLDLVLRRYVWRRFLDEDPDRPGHEAAVLAALEPFPVAAPRLVAVDSGGAACGVPALLMTRRPGRPEPRPPGWIAAAATAAAAVHAADPAGVEWRYLPYFEGRELQAPVWGDHRLWEAAVAATAGRTVAGDVFLHRDYHPGNLLWDEDRLSGIVDWLAACRGPRGVDVSHFRVNLALDHGPEAAASFLAAYRDASGITPDPGDDVVAALDILPFYENGAVDEWPHHGSGDPGEIRRRLEAFLARALTQA